MRKILALIHFVIGMSLFVVAVITLKDEWKTPSLFFFVFGLTAMVVGTGILQNQRWVVWLLGLLMVFGSFFALVFLAGSVMWPEYVAGVIFLVYGLFMVLEILSWVQMRRATRLPG